MARFEAPALKASTRRLYADTLDLHISPTLGAFFVDAITSTDVVAWRDSQTAKPVTVNGRLRIVSALKWSDIDEERKVIRFERAQVRNTVDSTKTDIVKEVPRVPQLTKVLQAHRRALIAHQAPGLSEGWVFPPRVGTLLQPSSLRTPLAKACASAKVRVISPHGLRYRFNHAAKRIAERDVVRSITGHITDEMTTHYDWVREHEKRGAVASVARLLCAGGGDAGGDGGPDEKTAD